MIFENSPSVVGHRGFGSGLRDGYRENTLASFQAAVAAGLSWVELDVHRSSDNQLMVCHDPVARSGRAIVACTAAELTADGVATLTEVLTMLPVGVAVDIDVKTIIDDAVDPPSHRTHALVADLLRRERGTRRVLVSSFDPSVVVYLDRHRDDIGQIALGLIAGVDFPVRNSISAAANLGLGAVCLHTDSLYLQAEDIIQTAHQAGLEVLTWSPGPADVARLAAAGVDAVCVNDIPGVQAALASAVRNR